MEQVISHLAVPEDQMYFWATHAGAEIDLVVGEGRRRRGFEFKRTSSPRVTPSIRSALEDLELKEVVVVHAGENTFPLAKRVRAVAADRLLDDL